MKVLILSYSFLPCPHSAAQRISAFAEALLSEGFEVTVVTASRCIKTRQRGLSRKNFLIYDLKFPRSLMSILSVVLNPILLFLYSSMSAFLALRKGFDIIVASVPYGEVAIAGLFISKVIGSPLIIDMRDFYPPQPESSLLYLHLPIKLNEILTSLFMVVYRSSSKIICVDYNIKNNLERFGIPCEKIEVISNGAETSIYKPCSYEKRERIRLKYGLPLDKFVFVYAGSLARYYPVTNAIKGLETMSLKGNDFQLLVISYLNYASVEKLVQKLKLEKKVQFFGPLSVNETAEVLSACDVGIVVYMGEDHWKGTYGAKIFSYLSCGLPLLASGPPGSVISNMISKHGVGFFVGKPYPENFAKGFSYFLNNKGDAKKLGENARKIVEKFYDREKLALRFASSLRDTHESRSDTDPF